MYAQVVLHVADFNARIIMHFDGIYVYLFLNTDWDAYDSFSCK